MHQERAQEQGKEQYQEKQPRNSNSSMKILLLVCCFLPFVYSQYEKSKDNSKCGMFLAPSSIPNSGLGMFAGHKTYYEGDQVTDGDIVIPIFEFEWHNRHKKPKYEHFLWDEYTWNGNVFPGSDQEIDEVDDLMFASPGVGAAANSFLSLVNIVDEWVKLGLSTSSQSPGVGAMSPYHGRSFTATSEIPPGAEIWVDYGENYFRSRSATYGYLPLPDDYPIADSLLKKYQRFRDFKKKRTGLDASFWKDLYQYIVDQKKIWKKSRVLNALPEDTSGMTQLLQNGGTAKMHLKHSVKDVSWLEENGQCMDNIKVGESKVSPDAGRGAFANRFIPKDGLVAPAPLVHIPDYDVLRIYDTMDVIEDNGEWRVDPDMDGPSTLQLLVNYCFGHHESTLLLCPYGLLTSFINHSNDDPNTKIVWNDKMRHKEWLDKPITSFGNEYHTGLQFDFVALRDIKEDEEILIDYGDVWESAWQNHIANYVPRENYTPAFELNKNLDTIEFRTVNERPYELDGIQLRCRAWYIKRFFENDEEDEDDTDYVCRITKRLGNDRYRVEILFDESEPRITRYTTGSVLWEVPSDAFFFSDMPYYRDHYQFTEFRHAMMVPDEIFPAEWKNLNRTK